MIHFHGLPITPDASAVEILLGRHAMVSFANPGQVELAAEVCQSWVIDNGAFSAFTSGAPIADWTPYYEFVERWRRHPGFEWAIIPDVIDGDERANDDLLAEWPFEECGVATFHLHESLERLDRLCATYPRIALGSSGKFWEVDSPAWWNRVNEVMEVACDERGRPRAKLHGLRMLNPGVFTKLPLASADSTNTGRNIGLDCRWKGGAYEIPKDLPVNKQHKSAITSQVKAWRGSVIAARAEVYNSASVWIPIPRQSDLYRLEAANV